LWEEEERPKRKQDKNEEEDDDDEGGYLFKKIYHALDFFFLLKTLSNLFFNELWIGIDRACHFTKNNTIKQKSHPWKTTKACHLLLCNLLKVS
jgi:hypothetical protein